jgi:hypothetical protein
MSRRCKPGQRARVIKETSAKGCIVLVVAAHHHGQEWGGASDWKPCIFPWKTISLGRPIKIHQGDEFWKMSMYCVFEDSDLEPLEDDDDGLTRSTEKSKPIKRPAAKKIATPTVESAED